MAGEDCPAEGHRQEASTHPERSVGDDDPPHE
jgi:hypothetical protein